MIIITAGHSGAHTGAVGVQLKEGERFDEGTQNIWLRNRISQILCDCYGCITLQDADNESLSVLTSRLNGIVNEGDFCLDIHFNASQKRTAHGTEVIVADDATSQEVALGIKIMNAAAKALLTDQRNLIRESATPRKRLAMLHLNCKSAILEVCFCTNAEDVERYFSNRELLAQAVARVLAENLLDMKPLCVLSLRKKCEMYKSCLLAMLHKKRRRRRLIKMIILLLMVALCSCSTSSYLSKSSFVRDSLFTQRLIPQVTATDSAYIEALFRCDSIGQVYLSMIESFAGENLTLRYALDSAGRFSVKTTSPPDTFYVIQSAERIYINSTDTVEKIVNRTKIVPSKAAKITIIVETILLLIISAIIVIYISVRKKFGKLFK